MTWRGVMRRRALRAPGERGESGETLVELLVTIVLMAVAFTAVLAAFFTASLAASRAQERTRVSVMLQTWSEVVLAPKIAQTNPNIAAGDTYDPCQPPSYLPPPRIRIRRGGTGDIGWTGGTTVGSTTTWVTDGGASGPNWTATMTVTYLNQPTTGSGNWQAPPFSATCSQVNVSGVNRDQGLMKVTLKVVTGGSRPTIDGLVLYRRDARCPTFNNPDQGPC